MNNTEIAVREIEPADHAWVRSFLGQHFGSTKVVSRGVMHQADDLPGFIATFSGEPGGLLTYRRTATHAAADDARLRVRLTRPR